MRSSLQSLDIFVDIPEQRDLSNPIEVAKMTRDFLNECSEKFGSNKLKHMFIADTNEETGLKQIFGVGTILSNRIS